MLSSFRNFFLALIISLILCGLGAHFLLGYISGIFSDGLWDENKVQTTDEYNGVNINADGSAPVEYTQFTVLFIGEDNGESQDDNNKKEADTIILVNINSQTKEILISPLSCEMRVEVKNYVMRLGAVYTDYGIETMINTIKSYTGLRTDYYCVFNYESIKALFEVWGDVEYTIPMDMVYMPKLYDEEGWETYFASLTPEEKEENERKPEINLIAEELISEEDGISRINGEQAVQLMRYKLYSSGNEERISIQIDFIKEVLRQKITFENLELAKDIYTAAKNSITDTNVDERTFEIYKDLIFALSTDYHITELRYPGNPKIENGVNFYVPNLTMALQQYSEYKKSSGQSILPKPTEKTEETAAETVEPAE